MSAISILLYFFLGFITIIFLFILVLGIQIFRAAYKTIQEVKHGIIKPEDLVKKARINKLLKPQGGCCGKESK
jgi:hypothetical protein